MAEEPIRRAVQIEMELRVTYKSEPGRLAAILRTLRQAGGRLYAHLVYRLQDESVGLFVCEQPDQAALALKEAGWTIETETVVTVRTHNSWGALSHLVQTLEAEAIDIGYSYASAGLDELYVVFLTDDNPKAEDVLRSFLLLDDFQELEPPS